LLFPLRFTFHFFDRQIASAPDLNRCVVASAARESYALPILLITSPTTIIVVEYV
jgi:hypothetical protein